MKISPSKNENVDFAKLCENMKLCQFIQWETLSVHRTGEGTLFLVKVKSPLIIQILSIIRSHLFIL